VKLRFYYLYNRVKFSKEKSSSCSLTVWLFSMNWTALSFTSFLTLLYVPNKVKETHKKIFIIKNITDCSIDLH